jgi:hypothetical protein
VALATSPAGLSKHSTNQVPAREWADARKYLVERSVYHANLKAITDRKEAQALALEEEMRVKKRARPIEKAKTWRDTIQGLRQLMTVKDSDDDDTRKPRQKLSSIWAKIHRTIKADRGILCGEIPRLLDLDHNLNRAINVLKAVDAGSDCFNDDEDAEVDIDLWGVLDTVEAMVASPKRVSRRAPIPSTHEVTVMTWGGPKKLRA